MVRKAIISVFLLTVILSLGAFVPPASANGLQPALNIQALPIVPSMSGWVGAQTAYVVRRGIRLGNRADVFSKIGDSITSWRYFLAPIAEGKLNLGTYGTLSGAVGFFSKDPTRVGNSFYDVSLAAHGGWKAADLLDPAKADPSVCKPNETPLDCELRVTRPSIALVMIGTNDLLDNNAYRFSLTLDRVLTAIEAHYVVPIVSTIPYRRDDPALQDRVEAYNQAIARVAINHGAPLWNYWLAMVNLPANGISNDGIHPSVPPDQNATAFDAAHLQFGFTMRNLTALEVLQSVMTVLK